MVSGRVVIAHCSDGPEGFSQRLEHMAVPRTLVIKSMTKQIEAHYFVAEHKEIRSERKVFRIE
jgi:hypothetical protein